MADTVGWALVGLLVGYSAFLAVAFNRFVRARNHLRDSWAAIDTELQRRRDLVPALVATVRGHAAHERGVLEAVTEARARAEAPHADHAGQLDDEERLSQALADALLVAERYPDITADESFRDLMDRLSTTEDRLAVARRYHNANVREWRMLGEALPWRLVRGVVRWRPEPYYAVSPSVRSQAA